MKILYHHRIGSIDGGEVVHIRELIAALRRLGHEVVVSGPVDLENPQARQPLAAALRLRDILPRALGELIEFSLSMPLFCILLVLYLRHRPNFVYERASPFSVATVLLKRITGCRLLVEVNAPLTVERSLYNGLALRWLAQWSEERVWRSADYVLPVTAALADIVRASGVADAHIAVIANGVRTDDLAVRSDAKAELGLAGHTVIGFVGYPRDWNRLERVVEALTEDALADARFAIIGDGPALAAVRERAQQLGVADRVLLVGAVARERVPHYVCAFDIAVQPGVTPYASPLKVVEYMALDRAIVAPDQPNMRELLRDGETALLFAPDDAASFRDCLVRLAGDAELRRRLGAAAGADIRRGDRTWDANARRVVELARQ